MRGTKRLFILEDDPTARNAVVELAAESTNVATTTSAGSLAQAREAMTRPIDIALVDLKLPDGSGVDFIAELRKAQPQAICVAFTVFDDAPNVLAAVRAGAKGYLLKSTPPSQLIARLLEAAEGQSPVSPAAARHLVDALAPQGQAGFGALTAREREVLTVLARGHSYQETAQLLTIGLGTVQGHVKAIYEKLDITSKAEAAAIAVRFGLI